MKRQIMVGALLSAVLVGGAAAQQPTQSSPQKSQDEKDQTVTLTGCLQAPPKAGTAGTTGDTTARQQAQRHEEYILTNVTLSSPSSTSTGTSGASSMSRAMSYRLIAHDNQDLDRWVNSRVEVKGTLEKSESDRSSTGTGTGSKETKTGQSEQSNMPTVRVTSARQVASSCSAQLLTPNA